MNNHKYKILEDNKKDQTAIRIEKSGIVHDFMIADMLTEQTELRRYIREFKSQGELELAKLENIKRFYPFVKKLSSKELFAAKMAFEASEVLRKVSEKVPELEEQLADSEAELTHICTKLKIKLPSKEELVEKAVSNITENGKS